MPATAPTPIAEIEDEELVEHLATWAAALRGVAGRWRFRAQAGRVGSHTIADVLRVAAHFDSVADLLVPLRPSNGERERAELVEDSRERFRLLVDNVRDYAVFLLDPDGRVASWNAGAERIKGYRAEEIIGRHFSIFYPPDKVEVGHPQHELELAMRTGRFHEEGWRVRKDGTRFWADVTITTLRDERGAVRGFAKITRDVTERREAEEALRASEERFRLLVDSVSDYAIVMLDPEGRVSSWSAGAEHVHGYTADEALHQPFARLYTREEIAAGKPEEHLERAAREGRLEDEGTRVRKDGTEFWADVVISSVRGSDGVLRGFGCVTRDITARRQAEDELSLFRLMVESVQEYAIFMLDPEGRVRTWSQGGERLKGYRADEIIGRHFSVFYPPEAVEAGHPQRELEIAAREGRYAEESWRVRKDGTQFWAGVAITALHDAHGNLTGFAKVTRDFTARRQAEDEVRRLNAELAQRVADRTAAFEELESFSYSVSHDLRAPLRGLDGFSKILIEKYGPTIDAQGLHYLTRIRAGAQRMGRLIDDLLRLSRITRADLRRARVDLGELAREVADELRKGEPEREVEVVVAEGLVVHADPQLLRVLLQNLIGNAWKFTSRTENARIEVGAELRKGETAFYVRDNGAGFDMEYADKLFQPFQRLHDASEFEGTGIGLATVRRVVMRHQGRVWAEGKPGEGATVWFTLGRKGRP